MKIPAWLFPFLIASLTAIGCATARADDPAGASAPGATAASSGMPGGLTGWRAQKGIFLSWSVTPPGGFTVWRGTRPGALEPLATLPPGQGGFWDTSAAKATPYFYALGDRKTHGAELELPGASPPVRIMAGLVTTCSGLARGTVYPADTRSVFTISRDQHVEFFGLFVMRPFDPASREARIVWRDPKGEVFSEFSHGVAPRRVEPVPGTGAEGTAGQIVLPQAIGLREAIEQNGQKRVPKEPGRYTIEVFVDDVPVAFTVFFLREDATVRPPAVAPAASPPPAMPGGVPRTTLPGAGIP